MKNFDEVIKYVLSKEPKLTGTGINAGYKYEDDPLREDEFDYCQKWLKEQKVTSVVNKSASSYHFKHLVEKWIEEKHGFHKYISNGSVIAAIIFLKIKYDRYRGTPNVFAAIKQVKTGQ